MNKLTYLTFIFVFISPAVWAIELAGSDGNATRLENTLQISPNTCVMQEHEEHCRFSIHIEVAEAPKVNYCLTFSKHIAKRCFPANTAAKIDLTIKLTDDTLIQMTSVDEQQVLAQAVLKVAIYKPIKRHRRRFTMGLL